MIPTSYELILPILAGAFGVAGLTPAFVLDFTGGAFFGAAGTARWRVALVGLGERILPTLATFGDSFFPSAFGLNPFRAGALEMGSDWRTGISFISAQAASVRWAIMEDCFGSARRWAWRADQRYAEIRYCGMKWARWASLPKDCRKTFFKLL